MISNFHKPSVHPGTVPGKESYHTSSMPALRPTITQAAITANGLRKDLAAIDADVHSRYLAVTGLPAESIKRFEYSHGVYFVLIDMSASGFIHHQLIGQVAIHLGAVQDRFHLYQLENAESTRL